MKLIFTYNKSGGSLRVVTLSELKKGIQASIVDVQTGDAFEEQLLEMGLTPGAPITLIRSGRLGQPSQFRVRNYLLSLRPEDAAFVEIQT